MIKIILFLKCSSCVRRFRLCGILYVGKLWGFWRFGYFIEYYGKDGCWGRGRF